MHGVTGRDIMEHLIAGERDPKVLVQLARKRARAKISQLEQALEGAEFFTPEHAGLLQAMLERIDTAGAQIGALSAVKLFQPGSSATQLSKLSQTTRSDSCSGSMWIPPAHATAAPV